MSYKDNLYKNALQAVEQIYKKSMTDMDIDLYRSLDIIQSVSDNQIKNKEWCADAIEPYLKDIESKRSKVHVLIMGSWYGLLSQILFHRTAEHVIFDNCDVDPESEEIGNKLSRCVGHNQQKRIRFRGAEAFEYFVEDPSKYHMIINTSCEHMDAGDLGMIPYMKSDDTIMCMQGNNYHSVTSHINTHNSLDEFTASLGLREVIWADTLEQEKYDRYMVIGK
jgi:hypothetical protein